MLRARAVLFPLLLMVACTRPTVPEAVAPEPRADSTDARPGAGSIHVLMVNGGADRARNYQSHLLHLKQLYPLLLRGGIDPSHVTVLSSDGEDPAPDLAVRDNSPDDGFWLIQRTRLDRPLRVPTRHVSSSMSGTRLEPATERRLKEWFASAKTRLRPGDTLLLYVTDHGSNGGDPPQSAITLWGGDSLEVGELGELLDELPPKVRVVTVMSQCHSGGFAELVPEPGATTNPVATYCGYFSTMAERPAYGCYPEDRGRENIGHSFELFRAIEETGSLAKAHDRILLTDATPDVPFRTSDYFLAGLVNLEEDPEDAEELLRIAFSRPARFTEIGLLESMAQTYGLSAPRSFAELDDADDRTGDLLEEADAYKRAWRSALDDARGILVGRFLATRADWSRRLDEGSLSKLGTDAAPSLRAALLHDLDVFLRTDPERDARLRTVRDRALAAKDLAYRLEVRDAVLLRMRWLLTRLAARALLESAPADDPDRRVFEELSACEALSLDLPPRAVAAEAARTAFSALEDDAAALAQVRPAWMGIRFHQADPEIRKRFGIAEGAAVVDEVNPASAAEASGIEAGDIIAGPPERIFTEPREIREWTMLLEPGVPVALIVYRNGQPFELTFTPQSFPLEPRERPDD